MNLIKNNIISLILIISSILGIYASLILSIDKLKILEDPNYNAGCKINSIIDCTKVIDTPEASVLGFPNSFFGLIAYSICFTFGLLLFLNKGNITNIVWKLGLPFATLAFLFSYWLLYRSESVYNALCPFCLVSATASTLIFSIFLYKVISERVKSSNITKYWIFGTVIWFVMIICLLVLRFM